MEGNNRLEVEHVLRRVVRPVAEVEVVLELHADGAGDRVLRAFAQLIDVAAALRGFGAGRGRRIGGQTSFQV
jgi:hypothetical protein